MEFLINFHRKEQELIDNEGPAGACIAHGIDSIAKPVSEWLQGNPDGCIVVLALPIIDGQPKFESD